MCFMRETVKMMIKVNGTDLRIISDLSSFTLPKVLVGGIACMAGEITGEERANPVNGS